MIWIMKQIQQLGSILQYIVNARFGRVGAETTDFIENPVAKLIRKQRCVQTKFGYI